MADTGWVMAGTGANDAAYGTNAWTSPENVTADDGSNAISYSNSGTPTQYIKATNFGLSVPSGSTITGIEFRIRAYDGIMMDHIVWDRVRVVKGGTIGSTDNSPDTEITSTEAAYTMGSTSELWGESWTHSDVNASTFGVVCAFTSTVMGGNVNVDSIEVRVTYTTGGGGSARGAAAIAGGW